MCFYPITAIMDSESISLAKYQHEQVMAKMDELSNILQAGLKTLYLVPVMLLFMLVTGTLFWFDKIPIWVWCPMNLIIMTPFFGEGVRMVLPLFPNRHEK